MCLLAWSWEPESAVPLVLLSNRDEYYARPTRVLHAWRDSPIIAGQDLDHGGTWLGLSRNPDDPDRFRVAALTNVCDACTPPRDTAHSRGTLVSAFLASSTSARDYLLAIAPTVGMHNPFNLLLYDGRELLGFESRNAPSVINLAPGIAAVSNAGFDTPWPKVLAIKAALKAALHHADPNPNANSDPNNPNPNTNPNTDPDPNLHPDPDPDPDSNPDPYPHPLPSCDSLLALLADPQPAPDDQLPDTGLPTASERALSSVFIRTHDYGTRASSVIVVRQADPAHLAGRVDPAAGEFYPMAPSAEGVRVRHTAEIAECCFDALGTAGLTRLAL